MCKREKVQSSKEGNGERGKKNMENIVEGEGTGRFGLRRGRKAEGEGKRGGGRRGREGRGR